MTNDPRKPQNPDPRPAKNARRAEALRANLHRRKAQARARAAEGEGEAADAASGEADQDQTMPRAGD